MIRLQGESGRTLRRESKMTWKQPTEETSPGKADVLVNIWRPEQTLKYEICHQGGWDQG